MNKQAIITALFTFFMVVQTVNADIIRGRVIDSDTKEPLPEASVKFTQQTGDNSFSIRNSKTDSLGVFTFYADGRGSLEVSMLGYYNKTKNVLVFGDSRKDTLDIGTIELKMSPQMLKMVEVTGRARRFTVRGDTIVFHPEAFHMQEGARLDELIRKLPGVEVDQEGQMSWNGKPIRLTMDGESILGGDDLVKQLPAEAVQDIKAYNKASEFSERTGKDDGSQDMVLDLNIKPGFLDRWYGDVKAGYENPDYYEGELTMNRLSKTDPILVFADANNLGKRHRRYMNLSMSMWGFGFGQEQGASAGWQHKWKEKSGSHELNSQYSFSGGLAHDDQWHTLHTETENYFPNTAASHINNKSYNRNHEFSPTINADMRWAKDSLNTFSLTASADYKRTRSHGREETEQEEQTSAGDYQPSLTQFINSRSEGHDTHLYSKAGWEHYVEDGKLGASITLNYTDGKSDRWYERTIISQSSTILSSQLSQYSTSPGSRLNMESEVHHARWLTKKWMIQAQYMFHTDKKRTDQDFLTDGQADTANSYSDHYGNLSHSVKLGSTINLDPVQLMPSLTAKWQRESQDYQRGMLDTAAVRHSFLIDPSLRATWKISKTVGFELNYSFRTSQPSIIETIGYRDLTNPLFITEGNPNLRDSHIHDIKLTYNMVIASSQTSISASIGYQDIDHDLTTALSYDPATAVYVSRPENIRGGHTWNFRLNYDQGIGDMLRLENEFRLDAEQRFGYLTLLPSQSERTINRQNNLHPKDKLKFSFDKNWLKASVFTEIEANQIRYSASPEQNTTLWDNNFGLEAEATFGNFVFESSITETTRRGYATRSMNKNMLLWDANITWKILKNKARLSLEIEDILDNEDAFWSDQTAYQHTSTWQDFHHHYVGISFTYHLDAKKK